MSMRLQRAIVSKGIAVKLSFRLSVVSIASILFIDSPSALLTIDFQVKTIEPPRYK